MAGGLLLLPGEQAFAVAQVEGAEGVFGVARCGYQAAVASSLWRTVAVVVSGAVS